MWATETASRPNVKSPTFSHLSKQGGMSRGDYVDLALSILNKTNQIENELQKHTLKFVYQGGLTRLASLAKNYSEVGEAKGSLVYYIALVSAHTAVWHSCEVSIYRAEQILACKRGELRKYAEQIRLAKDHVNRVLALAENELTHELMAIEVM